MYARPSNVVYSSYKGLYIPICKVELFVMHGSNFSRMPFLQCLNCWGLRGWTHSSWIYPRQFSRVTPGVNSNPFNGTRPIYCVHSAEDSNDKERGLFQKWSVTVSTEAKNVCQSMFSNFSGTIKYFCTLCTILTELCLSLTDFFLLKLEYCYAGALQITYKCSLYSEGFLTALWVPTHTLLFNGHYSRGTCVSQLPP